MFAMPLGLIERSTVTERRALRGLAYAVAFALLLALWPDTFLLDDAYITLSNARAVLVGSDPVYHTSPLVGATSAVHLALIVLLGAALPLPLASAVIGALGAVLYAAGLRAMALSVGCDGKKAALITGIGLLVGYQPLHYFNGLETGLAMAAVVWALALRDNRWLPLLCGLMPFIRPELALLAAPLFLRQVATLRALLRGTMLAGAAALPFAIWYVAETGLPWPNTSGAKIAFFAENFEPLSARLLATVIILAQSLILPLAIGLVRLPRLPAGWCVLFFVLAWIGVAAATFPSGLFHNHFRYLAPVAAALCFPLASLLASRPRSGVLEWALAAWTIFSLSASVPLFAPSLELGRAARATAEFVRDELPADAVVLVHDAGHVAWAQPKARLVDVVGLKTPASTAAHRRHTRRAYEWDLALADIARESHATHLVVLDDDEFWVGIRHALERGGWRLSLLRDSGQGRRYAVYRITPPNR
ncbi:MAG: hypothetical protein ACKO01_07535 [Erythrobacter sp.]